MKSSNNIGNKKLFIDSCIRHNHEILLCMPKAFNKNFEIIEIILKNTKTREEYACKFNKIDNFINLNLTHLSPFFTDYEGAITIVVKFNEDFLSLTPLMNSSQILIIDKTSKNNAFNWFIRILSNGELRFSTICNKIL